MDSFYENPPRYNYLVKKIMNFKRQNNNVKLFLAGKSVLGRKIYAAGVGDLQNAVLYAGAIHAQEWLTASLIMKFFEDVIVSKNMAGINLDDVFLKRGLVIVPMCNPDGVEIALGGVQTAKHLRKKIEQISKLSTRSWQANARGVDLNHNFDAGYQTLKEMEQNSGIKGPSPRQYGGLSANSEPETKALISITTHLDIKKVFAFHSQGEEIFYDYGENTPPNAKLLAEALSAFSGYKVCHPKGLASHGGFKDWFIKTTKRPGFTIEIGKGENPLPIGDLKEIYQKVKEMMLIGILL